MDKEIEVHTTMSTFPDEMPLALQTIVSPEPVSYEEKERHWKRVYDLDDEEDLDDQTVNEIQQIVIYAVHQKLSAMHIPVQDAWKQQREDFLQQVSKLDKRIHCHEDYMSAIRRNKGVASSLQAAIDEQLNQMVQELTGPTTENSQVEYSFGVVLKYAYIDGRAKLDFGIGGGGVWFLHFQGQLAVPREKRLGHGVDFFRQDSIPMNIHTLCITRSRKCQYGRTYYD